MKKLTIEQEAARDERRVKFKALWKQVADMPELERITMSNKLGIVNTDGHCLSIKNQCLIALQLPGASVVTGFRQWLKQGRCVKKGEHGAMIFCPTSKKGTPDTTGQAEPMESEMYFVISTVFDIGQTVELDADGRINVLEGSKAA